MIVRVLGIALMFTGIVLFISVWPIPDAPSDVKAFYAVVGVCATIGGVMANIIEGGD